jgi:hypothetical protein
MEVHGSTVVTRVEELGDDDGGRLEVQKKKSGLLVAQDELADAKFVEAALITEVVQSPTRASPRLASVAAEHTLVRAERLVQSRNLEFNKGNKISAPNCVLLLSNAVHNLRDLGLRVDSNNGCSFELSVQDLV